MTNSCIIFWVLGTVAISLPFSKGTIIRPPPHRPIPQPDCDDHHLNTRTDDAHSGVAVKDDERVAHHPIISCTTRTLIVVILDESGSMDVQKTDVIGGYNSFIDQQKMVRGDKGRLLLIKFSTSVRIAHHAIDIHEAPKLTTLTYVPNGGTALFDAVAEGIRTAEETAFPEERVLILIMTDGEENASRKTTGAGVKQMIKRKEESGHWTFAYIGENPGQWADRMGQSHHNVRQYDFHDQGSNMAKASDSVAKFRGAAAPQSKTFFQ